VSTPRRDNALRFAHGANEGASQVGASAIRHDPVAWIRIRSRRSAAFWAPLVAAPLLALLPSLLAQHWLDDHLPSLQALAASDPEAAARGAERGLRAVAWTAGGLALLVAALLARSCQLGRREGRLPPAGWWSLGARSAATGATAERLARAGLAVAALLAGLGLALALQVERLIRSLA
jgi:hypothetical protein